MTDKSRRRAALSDLERRSEARRIGEVVSGTQSPTLGIGIGLGYVPPTFGKPGTGVEIEIRGKRSPALVVQKPFYRKPN
jgi:aminomethyltransferase